MNYTKIFAALLVVTFITACESDPSDDLQDSIVEVTPETVDTVNPTALFDPTNSVIPFPNNLLFSGSADGTLNIPVVDETDLADPQVALNSIDGFSTVSPFSAGFSTAIDSDTVNGDSVRVYEVTLAVAGGPAGAINRQLIFGVDYVAAVSSVDTSQSSLAILPLIPLEEKSSYLVVITDDLMSSGGDAFAPSVTYQLIKTLSDPLVFGDASLPGALQSLDEATLATFESLRQIITVSETVVAASDADIEVSDIIQSWSFTTQSTGDVLAQVRTDIRAGAVPATAVGDSMSDSPLGAADIWVGSIEVPYYLTAASGVNGVEPLTEFWRGVGGSNLSQFNLNAVSTSTEAIPLMVSVPKTAMPVAGYPVVIYQHGITTNRTTLLAVADALAGEGLAAVAIDMPLHGVTGNETNGTQAFKTAFERTFDLDLLTQDATTGATTAAAPDDITDSSGSHFINLSNLQTLRDNLRQSVSDLFALNYALDNLSAGASTFDTSRIYLVGHSLGAMVGTTFAAMEPTVRDTVFAFGGGSLAKIIDGSSSFSPVLVAGLAAEGIVKGTPDYESFVGAAQTVIDTADPINFATDLVDKGNGLLFFEIVGGNSSPSDLTVPNTVPDGNDTSNTVPAPLAGTDPLLALMGLLPSVNTDQNAANSQHSVRFISGAHSSLLDPTPDPAVTAEIQTQMATFLATDGSSVDITDDSVILAP